MALAKSPQLASASPERPPSRPDEVSSNENHILFSKGLISINQLRLGDSVLTYSKSEGKLYTEVGWLSSSTVFCGISEWVPRFLILDVLPSLEEPFVSYWLAGWLIVSQTASSNVSFWSVSHSIWSNVNQMSETLIKCLRHLSNLSLSSWAGWTVQRRAVPLSSRSPLQMAQSHSVPAMLSSGWLSQHHCH